MELLVVQGLPAQGVRGTPSVDLGGLSVQHRTLEAGAGVISLLNTVSHCSRHASALDQRLAFIQTLSSVALTPPALWCPEPSSTHSLSFLHPHSAPRSPCVLLQSTPELLAFLRLHLRPQHSLQATREPLSRLPTPAPTDLRFLPLHVPITSLWH